MTRRSSAGAGMAVFLAFSFLGSWFVAASLRVFATAPPSDALGTRLFATALLYAVTMGWQPLLATYVVVRFIDRSDRAVLALRPARAVFTLIGTLGAIAFPLLAALVAWISTPDGAAPPTFSGGAESAFSPEPSSGFRSLVLVATLVGTLLLVWAQAFTEEIGWRGYFLPRAMQRFGRFTGLLAHGVIWGVWYAPVLFFATYGELTPFGSALRSVAFIVTSMLVGTLLGWLRLASKSLVPVVIANATLTLMAGLPYFVQGIDAGLRASVFGVPGWFVLSSAVALLTASRFRDAVRVPELAHAERPAKPMFFRAIVVEETRDSDRPTFH